MVVRDALRTAAVRRHEPALARHPPRNLERRERDVERDGLLPERAVEAQVERRLGVVVGRRQGGGRDERYDVAARGDLPEEQRLLGDDRRWPPRPIADAEALDHGRDEVAGVFAEAETAARVREAGLDDRVGPCAVTGLHLLYARTLELPDGR